MDLRVEQDGFNTVMTNLKASFQPLDDSGGNRFDSILDATRSYDMNATAYKTYFWQLMNMKNLMNYYYGLLSANCIAIENAVNSYIELDNNLTTSLNN